MSANGKRVARRRPRARRRSAGPTEFPAPQAAFMSPKPSPCASPIRSAPSERSAIAGAQNEPNAIAAATTSGAMKTGRPASGEPGGHSDARRSEASRSGSRRPRRSEKRPEQRRDHHLDGGGADEEPGDRGRAPAGVAQLERDEHGHDAEEERRAAPSARAPRGSAAAGPRRGGARGDCGSAGDRRSAERPDEQHERRSPATPTNAGRGPTASATAPTAGPSSAPKMAAPIAVPSISPRRSRGVPATSQARRAGPGERAPEPLREARDSESAAPSRRSRRRRSRPP